MNSYKSFLMHSTDGTSYTNVIPIKDFSDLGGNPDFLENTTLSDKMHTFEPGIEGGGVESVDCTYNYTKANYTAVEALADGQTHYWAIWFGGTESGGVVTPDGSDGKFSWQGILSNHKSGQGVNEVQEAVLSISVGTPIVFA